MSTTYYGLHNGVVLIGGFAARNPVTVAANGTVVGDAAYQGDAVYGANYAWSVSNLGTITGTGTASHGIALQAGGLVVNGSGGALIEGGQAGGGVTIGGNGGTVVNLGTIAGGAVAATVANFGTILGGAAAATVSNLGTILSQGTNGYGIDVSAHSVINGRSDSTAALIEGTRLGVAAESVTNFGTIVASGAANSGPASGVSGSVINYGTIAAFGTGSIGVFGDDASNGRPDATAALIEGYQNGVSGVDVTNFGTIAATGTSGRGVELGRIEEGFRPGHLVNGQSGSTAALIEGAFGAYVAGGSVINFGTIVATGMNGGGVHSASTVANFGTIVATGANGAGIDRGYIVANFGTIAAFGASGVGVALVYYASGRITNGQSGASGALIEGVRSGIYLGSAGGAVINFGTVAATGSVGIGITLVGGGTIVNEAGGYILGGIAAGGATTIANYGDIAHPTGTGILLSAGGTVVDAGTISGGSGAAAIFFGGTGSNLLVLDGGYQISGGIYGAADAANTLELAGSAAAPARVDFNTLGLVNFPTVAFAPGGGNYATLVIDDAAAPPGAIDGFAGAHEAIDLTGLSNVGNDATAGFDSATNVLTVTGDNGSATLQLDTQTYQTFRGFVVRNDGSGGTLVTVAPTPNVFTGTYTSGIVLSNPATQNPATITATGNVANYGVAVLGEAGFAWTLTNYGTIAGSGAGGIGVEFDAVGNVRNGASGATGALIAGAYSGIDIFAAAGTVANFGTVAGTGAGYATGIYFGAAGALANFGTITGTSSGSGIAVDLAAGGSVDNGAGGSILGYYIGLGSGGGSPSVANDGTIAASDAYGMGIFLAAGGTVVNHAGGLVNAAIGVYLAGADAAAFVNYGTIAGQYGLAVGYADSAANTITNAGTLSGTSAALVFGGGDDLLAVDPGAVFVGLVYAGSPADTLELVPGAQIGMLGTLTGLGSSFVGFGTVRVDPGADWAMAAAAGDPRITNDGTITVAGGSALALGRVGQDAGAHGIVAIGGGLIPFYRGGIAIFRSAVAAHQEVAFTGFRGTLRLVRPAGFAATIAGFGGADTIDLAGKAVDGLVYAHGRLTLTEEGTHIASLKFAGSYAATDFTLAPDGHGGTAIGFASGAAATGLAQPALPGAPGDLWTLHG